MIGYARIDQDSRLLEWNWEPWDGLDIEIGNAEIIDQLCRNGIEDFVIRDGMAYFEPTPEKAAQYEEETRRAELDEMIDELPDAVADLSEAVSDNAIDTSDIMDALAELSEIVSQLVEGMEHGEVLV